MKVIRSQRLNSCLGFAIIFAPRLLFHILTFILLLLSDTVILGQSDTNRIGSANIVAPLSSKSLIHPENLSSLSTSSNAIRIDVNPFQTFYDPIQTQNRSIIQNNPFELKLTNSAPTRQQKEIEQDLQNDEFYKRNCEEAEVRNCYRKAFNDLCHLNPNHFSITRAEYDIENAYLNGALPYDQFFHAIQIRAVHVKQLLREEHLSDKNNLALNYGIQQLYEHSNLFYDSSLHIRFLVPSFSYQFEDFEGKQDYENLFTEKLLRTGKGQCLSMPRLYLMIAEQLGAKAWLSLAPQHSFIQFIDSRNQLLNFETTNGHLTSTTWLAGSGYINSKALRSKSYLDTLSQRKLYAECLTELLLGYMKKATYDDFADEIKQTILSVDSNNMRVLIIDANIKRQVAFQKIITVGKPKLEELHNYPDAYQAYLEMKIAIDKVEDLGYQNMPDEAYKEWLRSIDQQKNRESEKNLDNKLNQEINGLKLRPSTVKSFNHN